MRSIQKGVEPPALTAWKHANRRSPQNLTYSGGGFPTEDVRRALLLEQFHLCAYTMRRLLTQQKCSTKVEVVAGKETALSCHIEHIYPQAEHQSRSVDYTNMVACFPPSQGSTACAFGAVEKKNYDPAQEPFESPLGQNASTQFFFHESGLVEGLSDRARKTVKVLNLNASVLVNDRKAVIRGAIKPGGKYLSSTAALQVVRKMGIPDAQHCLPAYCEAIRQLAQRLAKKQQGREAGLRKQARK
ncbi:hypothetical protein [Pseudomonas gingeri]|uniref:TIGR02646 family protein n=1 Tax=Pseudomonas gingeri TaxID=117681 RepID=A0A7Y7WNI8_9PSED|nr:hypothetical protein [Pseudomonas gingeri]NWB83847.1 hypothetical protein [Pseudomonas gingeri]